MRFWTDDKVTMKITHDSFCAFNSILALFPHSDDVDRPTVLLIGCCPRNNQSQTLHESLQS